MTVVEEDSSDQSGPTTSTDLCSSIHLTRRSPQEVHVGGQQGYHRDHHDKPDPSRSTAALAPINKQTPITSVTPKIASPIRFCSCCCIHRKRRSSNGTSSNGSASNDGVDSSTSSEKGQLSVLTNKTSISSYVTQLAKYPRWETTSTIYHYESVLNDTNSAHTCPSSPKLFSSLSNYANETMNSCDNHDDNLNVVLVLDTTTFSAHAGCTELFDLLKMKMRSTTRRTFSMNFEHVATLGKLSTSTMSMNGVNHPTNFDYQFYCPCDIKISYNCHVILVSDMGNRRIQVLDLATLRPRASINIAAKHLCIEANYDSRRNDALLVTCNDHCVYKYDLQQLIADSKLCSSTHSTSVKTNTSMATTATIAEPYKYIWRSGTPNVKGKASDQFNQPSGMAVWYGKSQPVVSSSNSQSSQNLIYVCDCNNNRIQVLQAHDGKVISSIGDFNSANKTHTTTDKQQRSPIQFKGPWDIQINEHAELVVCEVDTHRIQVLRQIVESSDACSGKNGSRSTTQQQNENYTWISTKSFGITKGYTSTFNHPRGVAIDKTREHIMLCDQDNNRIVVLHEKTGQVKCVFGSRGTMNGQFFKPHGICLNERTGELLVADYLNHRIQIFK
nr:unnamed protein product [Naegleria fowleri]